MAVRSRLPSELVRQLDKLIAIRREEAGLASVRTAVGQARMKELNGQDDTLSESLARESPEIRSLIGSVSLDEVSARLGTAALAEYVMYREFHPPKQPGKLWGALRYGVYLVQRESGVRWLDLGPVDEIDRIVRRYRAAINSPDNQTAVKAAAREIDRLAFEPIRQTLPGVTDFYVAAEGLLRLVPLAVMRDSSGDYLIEHYKIHTLLTGRDLLRSLPINSAEPPIVGALEEFGKPGWQVTFQPIPGAIAEMREVAAVIRPKPNLLSPDQMTKRSLMEKINGPSILHLATHGYYDKEQGGLALRDANASAGNILTYNDVAKLNLFGTQLAVLSACETGLGEVNFADGITGLQRSLTLAGARSQILTLWPVSDSKTKELMVSFYRNLFEKGMTKAEALRQAQLEMAHLGLPEYYWAPFVLYGDGGSLGK